MIGEITPEDMIYLVSTIHFKGNWTFPFQKELTRLAPFYLQDGNPITTEMMSARKAPYRYYRDSHKTLLDIPYGNLPYSMTILLPHPGDSLPGIIQTLSARELQQNLAQTDTVVYHLQMPKFAIQYSTTLKESLSALGMQEAFSEKACFPGFSAARTPRISNVLHHASIEVDEQGTIASAAAGLVLQRAQGSPQQVVSVDRPFIFLIRENHSGAILFAGMVTNPAQ